MSENQGLNPNLTEEEVKSLKLKAKVQGNMAYLLGRILLVMTVFIFLAGGFTKHREVLYLTILTVPLGIAFLLFARNLKKLSN